MRGKGVGLERGKILYEGAPEGLDLVRVEFCRDHERADALEAHVGNADAVHELTFILIGAVQTAGAVAAEQVGQHVERGGLVALRSRHGQGGGEVDLIPRAGLHGQHGAASGQGQAVGLIGQDFAQRGGVLVGRELPFGLG